jgi:hypothetical protein
VHSADAGSRVTLTHHYQLQILKPLTVTVGEQTLALGTVDERLLSARFVTEDGDLVAVPLLNDTMYRMFAPDEPVPDHPDGRLQGADLGPIDDADA